MPSIENIWRVDDYVEQGLLSFAQTTGDKSVVEARDARGTFYI